MACIKPQTLANSHGLLRWTRIGIDFTTQPIPTFYNKTSILPRYINITVPLDDDYIDLIDHCFYSDHVFGKQHIENTLQIDLFVRQIEIALYCEQPDRLRGGEGPNLSHIIAFVDTYELYHSIINVNTQTIEYQYVHWEQQDTADLFRIYKYDDSGHTSFIIWDEDGNDSHTNADRQQPVGANLEDLLSETDIHNIEILEDDNNIEGLEENSLVDTHSEEFILRIKQRLRKMFFYYLNKLLREEIRFHGILLISEEPEVKSYDNSIDLINRSTAYLPPVKYRNSIVCEKQRTTIIESSLLTGILPHLKEFARKAYLLISFVDKTAFSRSAFNRMLV